MIRYWCIILLTIPLFSLIVNPKLHAQQHISWDHLAAVNFVEKYDSSLMMNILEGQYHENLQALDNESVIISGYVIPMDAMGITYALSRSSYASCFFCGQAGPETVLELKVTPRSIPPEKQNNYKLQFKGTLKLRKNNLKGLHYVLEDATLLSP